MQEEARGPRADVGSPLVSRTPKPLPSWGNPLQRASTLRDTTVKRFPTSSNGAWPHVRPFKVWNGILPHFHGRLRLFVCFLSLSLFLYLSLSLTFFDFDCWKEIWRCQLFHF